MLRLTREVRFFIAPSGVCRPGHNGFGGNPAADGLGQFFCLRVTVAGAPDPATQYLLNIKEIDRAVRQNCVAVCQRALQQDRPPQELVREIYALLRGFWPATPVVAVELWLNPFLSLCVHHPEIEMVHLTQHFEFCASHRLFNPALSPEENLALFGKCSNPHGHGHNYQVAVTVDVEPAATGSPLQPGELERRVNEAVIEPFDHKNLNLEVPEFRERIPTVENIAKVIFDRLKHCLERVYVELSSVKVWESARTCAEYSEPK